MAERKNEVLSRTVSFLRFPLIVSVLFSHTGLMEVRMEGQVQASAEMYPLFNLVQSVVRDEVMGVDLSLFAFFAGFFFFYRLDFSWAKYGRKLKNRVHTLLVPYLFWNLFIVAVWFLMQTFCPSLMGGEKKLVADFGWKDWAGVFWNFMDGMPACYPFWFIRDLMVLSVCAPLVYVYFRYLRHWGLALVGVLYLADVLPDFSVCYLLPYYCWGAWFSVCGKDFTDVFRPYLRQSLWGYVVLAILHQLFVRVVPGMMEWGFLVYRVEMLVGMVLVVSATACGISSGKLKVNPWLTGSVLLIYAYHPMAMSMLSKMWVRYCHPSTDGAFIAAFLILPFLVAFIGVGLYAVGKRCCPRLLAVVTGGR